MTKAAVSNYIVITQTEERSMKARLVRIGNSRGVRLPKPMIEEAGLADEVEISVREGTILIASAQRPRTGWAEAARRLRDSGQDSAVDPPTATRFDEEEWEW
ncbi:MAG: AbrB/MazE/SpoVT family DNA-binding domain-containing protein [Candidatus Latescibacterota bacterium]